MTNFRRFVGSAFAAVLACTPIAASADDGAVGDPVEMLQGTWKIVGDDGKIALDCDKGQIFTPSADRTHVLLTEKGGTFSANYRVIITDGGRLLTYIEGEDRKTDQGDPVLWWAYFRDRDHFRWRRYDWLAQNATLAEWVRCPPIGKDNRAN